MLICRLIQACFQANRVCDPVGPWVCPTASRGTGYSGGQFVLLAVVGNGMPASANQALLFRHLEQAPAEFDGVMVWKGSKERGEIIQNDCLRAAGVPARP
jgi:hypothetical protein